MRAWSLTLSPGRLHYSQAQCRACSLVFSNPVCDGTELESYYRDEYWETHWPEALNRDPSAVEQSLLQQVSEVERLRRFVPGGKLLEVGSGTGTFLAAARAAGFEVWGVEASAAGVKHSSEVFQLDRIVQGSLPDPNLPSESFDVVVAWHVIEHVVDLDCFIEEIRHLLVSGGVFYIGTENYRNSTHYLDRAMSVLRGDPPPFATASEHTLAFTSRTLTDSLSRRGFDVIACETYQPSLREKLKTMRFRNPLSHGYFVAQHLANAIMRTGPLMRAVARKN